MRMLPYHCNFLNPGQPAPVTADELAAFAADFWNCNVRFGGLYEPERENAAFLFLNSERQTTGFVHVYGDDNQVHLPWDTALEFGISMRSRFVLFAHSHPSGSSLEPSIQDRAAFRWGRKFFGEQAIEVLDELIFPGDFGGYYSEQLAAPYLRT